MNETEPLEFGPTHFEDHQNNRWEFNLTVGSVMRLAKYYECDPNDVITKRVAEVMVGGSPLDLCVLLWGLLKDQAAEKEITQEQFQDCFSPDDYEKAAEALQNAIVTFTRPAQRKALLETLEQVQAMQEKATQRAINQLKDPQTQEELLDQLGRNFKRDLSLTVPSTGAGGQED